MAMTTSQKGALAEAEIVAAATRLHLVVLRPFAEGARYDLAIDIGVKLLRVQCKWASRCGDVLAVRCATSRRIHRGYLKTTYTADEIDAIAACSADTDKCYLIPIEEAGGMAAISLRLAPTRNNQALNVRWARHYEFDAILANRWGAGPSRPPEASAEGDRMGRPGAIAQLGER